MILDSIHTLIPEISHFIPMNGLHSFDVYNPFRANEVESVVSRSSKQPGLDLDREFNGGHTQNVSNVSMRQ